jgi:hypothetical protein
VLETLSERKSFAGWMADLGNNFMVNVLTVIVIGLAVVGSGALDALSTFLHQSIESKASPAPRPQAGNAAGASQAAP